MSVWGKILQFLQSEMPTPTNYGWFHLMWWGILLLSTILICVRFRDCDEKVFRRILLISWLIMVVWETYKEVVYALSYTDNGLVWDYQWYIFPFQLCSTPLYVLPLILLIKQKHIREALLGYITFFSFFGGVVVFFYPNDVFIETIGVNIQTMLHHGIQVMLGIFIACRFRKNFTLTRFLKSIPVFVSMLVIALLMNICMYPLTLEGMPLAGESFNMFYIGPYFPCHFPILSTIYTSVPYVVFFLIYGLGFILCAFIMWSIQKGVILLVEKSKGIRHASTHS